MGGPRSRWPWATQKSNDSSQCGRSPWRAVVWWYCPPVRLRARNAFVASRSSPAPTRTSRCTWGASSSTNAIESRDAICGEGRREGTASAYGHPES